MDTWMKEFGELRNKTNKIRNMQKVHMADIRDIHDRKKKEYD